MIDKEREEAIEVLKAIIPKDSRGNGKVLNTLAITKAILMGIEALEQPKTSDDCISRKVLIEKLHSRFADGFDSDKWWNSTSVLCAVYGAPSVTPLTTPLTASLSIEQIIKDTIKEYIGKPHDDVTELLLALNKDLCERIRKENMNGL